MTLLTTVKDVCAAVGVEIPASVFVNLANNRTMQEMLALANEMAQRIAYDAEHDWSRLKVPFEKVTDGIEDRHSLPADYHRLLLTSNIWRQSTPMMPMRFISDHDEWLNRRMRGINDPRGEWINIDGRLWIVPTMAAGDVLRFVYVEKNCVALPTIGGVNDVFTNDLDVFRLNERLLKLGMIWQWRASKGSPYAEDMGTYNDALALAIGKDSPAPIIIGSKPLPAAVNYAYPFPFPAGMVPL